MTPRVACSGNRAVRIDDGPNHHTNGNSSINPNAERKNAISTGGTAPDNPRIIAFMVAKRNVAARTQTIPSSGPRAHQRTPSLGAASALVSV